MGFFKYNQVNLGYNCNYRCVCSFYVFLCKVFLSFVLCIVNCFFYCILFYICLFKNGIWFWGKIKKKHRTRITFSSLMNKVICISSHFLVTQLNNMVLLCSPNCTPNLCYFNSPWQEVLSGYLPINSQQGIYFPSCNL